MFSAEKVVPTLYVTIAGVPGFCTLKIHCENKVAGPMWIVAKALSVGSIDI